MKKAEFRRGLDCKWCKTPYADHPPGMVEDKCPNPYAEYEDARPKSTYSGICRKCRHQAWQHTGEYKDEKYPCKVKDCPCDHLEIKKPDNEYLDRELWSQSK